MLAAVKHAPNDLRVEEVPRPEPGPNDVLIQVKAGGICGTDVHVLTGDHDSVVPVVLGHEYAGVIAAVGPEVQGLKVGQPVMAGGGYGCGTCPTCRSGNETACKERRSLGRNVNGSFAEYVAVPARIVLPLPESVAMREAQSGVGVSTVIRGWNKVRPRFGDRVAIVGAGHAGLVFTQLARQGGAGLTFVAGTRESRTAKARELGADIAVNVRTEDLGKAAREATDGRGFDLVIEAAGNPEAFRQAVDLAGHGATVLMYGMSSQPLEKFETEVLYRKDLTITGTRGSDYPRALQLMACQQVRIAPLVTHVFPLSRANEAFRLMTEKHPDALRVVIEP